MAIKRWMMTVFALGILTSVSMASSLEERYDHLSSRVVCQCGCNIVLKECPHPTCYSRDELRSFIQNAIRRGESDEAILASLVTIYGERILAAPKAEGFNLVAWVLPFVALLIGVGLVITLVKRWSHFKESSVRTVETQKGVVDPNYLHRVEEELKELDR